MKKQLLNTAMTHASGKLPTSLDHSIILSKTLAHHKSFYVFYTATQFCLLYEKNREAEYNNRTFKVLGHFEVLVNAGKDN